MAATKSAPPRPLIGLAGDYLTPKNGTPYVRANAGYVDAVLAAGGLPVILPPVRKDNFPELETYLDLVAGVVLVGGLDLDPRRMGQQLGAASQPMAGRREDSDRLLLTKIVERRLPVLGIGVGMQLINVHFGGTLFAHLPLDVPRAMPHFDPTGGPHRHMVNVEPNTTLQDMYGADELRVNSQHHQGVNQVGKRLRVAARAPDGVIEAVETTDDTWFCVGVQWHPEADTASALDRQIFDCLVQAAAKHEPALVEV
jgi:putative glutamine amidotransferase